MAPFASPATGGTRERHARSDPAGVPERHAPATKFTRLERGVARRLLKLAGNPRIVLVLPDGTPIQSDSPHTAGPAPGGGPERLPSFRLLDRGAFWRLLADPMFQFGELYSAGRLRIDGDPVELLAAIYRGLARAADRPSLRRSVSQWIHRRAGATLHRSKENIHHHYDIGNEFYKLWLDARMAYTCAYFAEPTTSLEAAQRAKMDHVCRKLLLAPGETVQEAGCGWGGLALHMARHYGVRVKAFNISREQIAFARDWARRERLDDRIEFVEDDWRNMADPCDAFVSVGMLEHVGPENYRHLGRVIDRCLVPGGRGLIHSIGRNRPAGLDTWIERRIFPGAYPPSLREMSDVFEPCSMTVLDVENLCPHYAETLRHWRDRFERAAGAVRRMFDARFVRMWRLYLCGSIAAFDTGELQLFQVLFAKGDWQRYPWNRAHLYAGRLRPTATTKTRRIPRRSAGMQRKWRRATY